MYDDQKILVLLIIATLFFSACGAVKETVSTTKQESTTNESQEPITAPMPSTDDSDTEEDFGEETTTKEVETQITMEMLEELLNQSGNIQTTDPRPYRATHKRINDLLHTKLAVSFDWDKQHVLGQATLDLEPFFYPTQTLTLEAKGFDIHEVALLKGSQKTPLKYDYSDTMKLNITLDKEYKKGEKYTVFIDYTAKPDELEANSEAITYDNKGLYFIDPKGDDPSRPSQIWTQGETQSSSCWFPVIDHPNERTSQEVAITVADKYVTLSNGKMLSSAKNGDGTRTDVWEQKLGHAPYLFAMVIGEYAITKDKWRDIEVNYYVEPAYKDDAQAIFGNTPKMIEFFSKKLDYDYPWDKYSQVIIRDFVAGAMENTGAVTFYEEVQSTTRELEDTDHEDIIAHELFHHWFGDLLTCESWSNLPLNESFATYGEYLWFEEAYGRERADYHLSKDLDMYLSEAQTKQVPIFRFKYDTEDDLFDRHSYQKGGRVLHLLRKYLGDDAFFQSLQTYIKAHEFQSVEVHDLRQAFEQVSGEDLNWFFEQWFLGAGHPILNISYDYDEKLKQSIVSIDQTQKNNLFTVPLFIDIYHEDGKKDRQKIVLEERNSVFTFDADKRPKLINVDAEKVLLGEKTDNKTLEEWTYQYENAPLFLDRFESLIAFSQQQTTSAKALSMLQKGLKDKFWVIRREAIERLESNELAAVKSTLSTLAQKDKKSLVRAAAINRLSELKDKELSSLLEKSLDDRSYAVVSASLNALYELDPNTAINKVEKLEGEKNASIANIIGKIYGDSGTADKQNFFEEKLADPAYDHYTLLDHYSNFLKRNDKNLDKGLPTIEKIALNARNWWVRLSATQALVNIVNEYSEKAKALKDSEANPDSAEVKKLDGQINGLMVLINDIKAQEKDEKLQYYYSNM